jgi:hypothetical protein
LLYSVLLRRCTPGAARTDIVTARPCDELRPKPRLFGKFRARRDRRGGLRTLFIKLEFILSERRTRMVNDACAARRQAVNAVLSR